MKPFVVHLRAYVMADDQVDAMRRGRWLYAAAITNHMEPGGIDVEPATDVQIENSKPLQRMIDRHTRPEHGAPATVAERRHLVRALAAANGGDLTTGETIVKTLEQGAGYLPRTIAQRLLELHPLPVRAAA